MARARLLVMLLSLTILVLLTAGRRASTRVVEAERFILRKDGTYYGEIGFSPSGIPAVILAPGNEKAIEQLPESRAGFYLSGSKGRASLQLGPDGGATLEVGQPELMSIVSEEGFVVYRDGKWKWGAP